MSSDHVAMIIGKAATDGEFRNMLMNNPEEALKDYELSDEEKQALMDMDSEALTSFSKSLDERITKGFVASGI
jgi:hypothetical protein